MSQQCGGDAPPAWEGQGEKICRICYAGAEEDGELIRPCDCRGSLQWVHPPCLEEWCRQRAVAPEIGADFTDEGLRCEVCMGPFATVQISRPMSGIRSVCRCLCQACLDAVRPPPLADWLDQVVESFRDRDRQTKAVMPLACLTVWWLMGFGIRPGSLRAQSWSFQIFVQSGRLLLPLALWLHAAVLFASSDGTGTPPLLFLSVFYVGDPSAAREYYRVFAVASFTILGFAVSSHMTPDDRHGLEIPWSSAFWCLLPALALLAHRLTRVGSCAKVRAAFDTAWYFFWPPISLVLSPRSHVGYVACVAAIVTARCLWVALSQVGDWFARQLVLFLCQTDPTAVGSDRCKSRALPPDLILAYASIAPVCCGVAMSLHAPLLVRSFIVACHARSLPTDQARLWARIGLIAGVWLPLAAIPDCHVNVCWVYCLALLCWAVAVLGLCVLMGAPLLAELRDWVLGAWNLVRSLCAQRYWQARLHLRTVAFIERPRDRKLREPLLVVD